MKYALPVNPDNKPNSFEKKQKRLMSSDNFKRPTLAERLENYKAALPHKTTEEIEEDRQWLRMPPVGREIL